MEIAVLTGLLTIALYSAALFLGVLLFRRVCYQWLSPALRYALWFLVVLRLAVPVTFESGFHFITLPADASGIAAPASAAAPGLPATPDSGDAPRLDGGTQESPGGAQSMPSQPSEAPAPARRAWKPSLPQGLLLLWAAGAVAVIAVRAAMTVQLMRRVQRLGRAPGAQVRQTCDRIRSGLGVRAEIPLFLLPDLTSPALTAQLRPKLLLPDRLALGAPNERLAFSLLHELMHFKRRDYLVCLLLTLLGAIWWFNPVMWLLPKYLRTDMESACDAQAARKLDPEQKLRYANLLLELGQREPRA